MFFSVAECLRDAGDESASYGLHPNPPGCGYRAIARAERRRSQELAAAARGA